jgi:hypothetical protein
LESGRGRNQLLSLLLHQQAYLTEVEGNRVFDHTHGLLSAGASVARQNAITGEEVLSAGRESEEPVRIWHACCATGEEAYSVAVLILEYLD